MGGLVEVAMFLCVSSFPQAFGGGSPRGYLDYPAFEGNEA